MAPVLPFSPPGVPTVAEMTWNGEAALDRFRAAVMARCEAAAEVVAEAARANCPVRTGALKASIQAGPAEVDGDVVRSTVTARAPYAAWVEFGTIHEPPAHFLTGALGLAATRVRTILTSR